MSVAADLRRALREVEVQSRRQTTEIKLAIVELAKIAVTITDVEREAEQMLLLQATERRMDAMQREMEAKIVAAQKQARVEAQKPLRVRGIKWTVDGNRYTLAIQAERVADQEVADMTKRVTRDEVATVAQLRDDRKAPPQAVQHPIPEAVPPPVDILSAEPMEVTVPKGYAAGDTITLDLGAGRELDVQIPDGHREGDMFEVELLLSSDSDNVDTTASSSQSENLQHSAGISGEPPRAKQTAAAREPEPEPEEQPKPHPGQEEELDDSGSDDSDEFSDSEWDDARTGDALGKSRDSFARREHAREADARLIIEASKVAAGGGGVATATATID
jgi:hypothetical protein